MFFLHRLMWGSSVYLSSLRHLGCETNGLYGLERHIDLLLLRLADPCRQKHPTLSCRRVSTSSHTRVLTDSLFSAWYSNKTVPPCRCWCGGCELLDEGRHRYDRHGATACSGYPCSGEASRDCGAFDAFSLYYRGTCGGWREQRARKVHHPQWFLTLPLGNPKVWPGPPNLVVRSLYLVSTVAWRAVSVLLFQNVRSTSVHYPSVSSRPFILPL